MLGWRVTKYAAEIKADDTVYVCFGGPREICPGLYATATILTPPDTIESKAWERKYEAPGVPLPPHVLGVWLKIEQHLAPPVARSDIYDLEEMKDSQFVKTHGNGTNFRLTPKQASAIEGLIAKPRALGDPTRAGSRSGSTRLAAAKSGRSQPDRLEHP